HEEGRLVEILHLLAIESHALLLDAELRQPSRLESHNNRAGPALFEQPFRRRQTAQQRSRRETLEGPCLGAIKAQVLDSPAYSLGLSDRVACKDASNAQQAYQAYIEPACISIGSNHGHSPPMLRLATRPPYVG